MEEPKVFIKDIDDLREFIKLNRQKRDYFDHIIEKTRSGE